MSAPSRRRFLQLTAATSAVALCGLRGAIAAPQPQIWQGSALGADATITLGGLEALQADAIFQECLEKISRLESEFSLYVEHSALSKLNRDGALDTPSTDFLELLEVSREIFEVTKGAFDPTVQPLWRVHASGGASAAAVSAAQALADFTNVSWTPQRVAYMREGMAMTLNGIAQGYITDRIADLLRARGLTSVLVNLGEYSAIGSHPELRPWQVGIQDPKTANALVEIVELQNEAMATSGAYGGLIGSDSKTNHLFDPRSGQSAERYLSVSVIHPSATIADGLSTAFSFLNEAEISHAVRALQGAKVLLVQTDGTLTRI